MDKWYNAAMARLVELQSAEGPVGGIQVFSAAPRQTPLANMKVTTKISIDLTRPNIGTSVDAMQGDGNTRYVEASLLSGGRPWEPPDGVEIAVVYNKPDDTRGMYNKLPDDTPAVAVEGNVVTIILAPQMLTVPGIVRVGIVINNDSLDQLTTFPFDLSVARNQFAGAQISEDYIRLEWLEDKLDEYLQKAADSGAFKGDPFTYEDFTPAQLAALQGPAGKSAYQYAVEGGYTGTEAEFSALVAYDSRKQIEIVKDTMIRLHDGVVNDASGTVIALSDASDGPLQGLRIYGKTTQDGTPTPEAPVELVSVGDGGSVGVTVAGKNLLMLKHVGSETVTTINTDGSVTVKNNSEAVTSGASAVLTDNIPAGRYTITNILGSDCFLQFASGDYSIGVHVGKSLSFDYNGGFFRIVTANINAGNSVTYKIQLERGDKSTSFEPYINPQTLPISTTNGLPGIPVTSGGNYTDANGQQWVCNVVDLARGVYVQRIQSATLTGAEAIKQFANVTGAFQLDVLGGVHIPGYVKVPTNIMCNYYQPRARKSLAEKTEIGVGIASENGLIIYDDTLSTATMLKNKLSELYSAGNPVKVLAILKTPVETPIPADELAAYAALHTNKPNTTIYNDAGAHMDVEYVADTKLYIDQKINELATAIVSST